MYVCLFAVKGSCVIKQSNVFVAIKKSLNTEKKIEINCSALGVKGIEALHTEGSSQSAANRRTH